MDQIKKEYQTELEPREKRTRKATEKVESVLRFAKLGDSSGRGNKDSTFASNQASFSFEKEKLQQLQVGPSYATDVNDDNIQKLKEDILKQCQAATQEYDRVMTFLHVVAIIILSLNVVEVIACFFLLLILSIQYVPSDQIMLWIGSAMLLCVGEIFIALRAINYSQGRSMLELRSFLRLAIGFLVVFGLVLVLLILTLRLVSIPVAKALTDNQKRLLQFVKGMLVVLTVLKVLGQSIFVYLAVVLIRQLKTLSCEESPNPTSTPSLSYRFLWHFSCYCVGCSLREYHLNPTGSRQQSS